MEIFKFKGGYVIIFRGKALVNQIKLSPFFEAIKKPWRHVESRGAPEITFKDMNKKFEKVF